MQVGLVVKETAAEKIPINSGCCLVLIPEDAEGLIRVHSRVRQDVLHLLTAEVGRSSSDPWLAFPAGRCNHPNGDNKKHHDVVCWFLQELQGGLQSSHLVQDRLFMPLQVHASGLEAMENLRVVFLETGGASGQHQEPRKLL